MNQIFIKELQQLLSYNPTTGVLEWKPRPRAMFGRDQDHKAWNTKFAGKLAFTSTNPDGYRRGRIHNTDFKAHRVAYALHHGIWPVGHIDHINGNRADNRAINLRDVNRFENQKNMKRSVRNRSGHVGVSWDKKSEKWYAYIRVNGKTTYLGLFTNVEDAAAARTAANQEHKYHQNHGRDD